MRPQPLHTRSKDNVSPAYVGAVMICLQSSQAALDIFLSMGTPTLRCIPVIVYTRMFYAVVILSKLLLCTSAPNSFVGKLLDAESIKMSFYLHGLMSALQKAASKENFSVPSTFLSVLAKLTAWLHQQQAEPRISTRSGEVLEAMAYLNKKDNSREHLAMNTHTTPDVDTVAGLHSTSPNNLKYRGSNELLRSDNALLNPPPWLTGGASPYRSDRSSNSYDLPHLEDPIQDQLSWNQSQFHGIEFGGTFDAFADYGTFSSGNSFDNNAFLVFTTEDMGDTGHGMERQNTSSF
jgi:hypothetical protein